MKLKTQLLTLLVLIVSLNTYSQSDSITISLEQGRKLVLANEQLKQCIEITHALDSQIVDLSKVIEVKDEKIGDLYHIIDLNKDITLEKESQNVIFEIEVKSLKQEVRRQKLKNVLIGVCAAIVEGVTIYAYLMK